MIDLNYLRELVAELYGGAIREHYVCDEDYYYSCPMAEEPTWSDKVKKCDCGAEQHNKEVEDLYLKILTLIN
jgi:hypothetical protein